MLSLLLVGCGSGSGDRQWTSDQLDSAASAYLTAEGSRSPVVTCPEHNLHMGGHVTCKVRLRDFVSVRIATTPSGDLRFRPVYPMAIAN